MTKSIFTPSAVRMRHDLLREYDGKFEILLTDFYGKKQGNDTTKIMDLVPGPRGSHTGRFKFDIKGLDPIAYQEYKNRGKYRDIKFIDTVKSTEEEIKNYIKYSDFDFAFWNISDGNFSCKDAPNHNVPVIVQAGSCNFRCGYCFVDDESKDGNPDGKIFASADEVVKCLFDGKKMVDEKYKNVREDADHKVFRLSGGDFTPATLDFVRSVCEKTHEINPDITIRLDSNLSFGEIYDDFVDMGIYDDKILKDLAKHKVKVLAAIKGTDQKSLEKNVRARASMDNQFYSLEKLVEAGLEAFIQIYNPNPLTLPSCLKDMDKRIENASLRSHISTLDVSYEPTKERLGKMAVKQGLSNEKYINEYKTSLENNYNKGCDEMEKYIMENFGVHYKDTPRPDVKLRLL